jgi:SAM-dependent methyltransferase
MAKDNNGRTGRHRVRDQYERWPYPAVPALARVRAKDAWQAQVDYILDRCGRDAPTGRRPSIWIAGCGTFEAYPFAIANPRARILASDWSRPSLEIARRRLWVQGVRHVELREIDLEDPEDAPDETFDLIVCTGVLMNLRDPRAALRRMRDRLEPGGVLRIMVYPHYSRQRIFWIQRIARSLGLDHEIRRAPRLLRDLMTRALPTSHPLRFTFERYRDTRFDAGIVDAFLHAGDRGYTGRELGTLVHDAGLRAAAFDHRPWGQPHLQAARLGLDPERPFEVLHDLDLWQELRTNFTVCCVRQDSPRGESEDGAQGTSDVAASSRVLRPHPSFTRTGRGTRGRIELLAESLVGVELPSRTHDGPLRVPARALRVLERVVRPGRPVDAWLVRELCEQGLLLGGSQPIEDRLGPLDPNRPADDEPHLVGWRCGDLVPNPLHAALFAAWSRAFDNGSEEESLIERIDRRASPVEVLEDGRCPFGLTPAGSAHALPDDGDAAADLLFDLLEGDPGETTDPDDVEIVGHDVPRELDDVLRRVSGLPRAAELARGAQNELWVALCGWRELTLITRRVEAAAHQPSRAVTLG